MIRRAIMPWTSCLVLLILFTTTFSTAVFAGAYDVRYNGVTVAMVGIDTAKINQLLPASYGELGSQLIAVGIEGMAGELNGWVVGGFGLKGELASAKATNRAEFEVALGGLVFERPLLLQSNKEIFGGARLGVGRYTLRLTQTANEDNIKSIGDAAQIATSTTLQSPVWYLEPSIGMRARLGELLMLEGRLGYGISMSNGEWRHNGNLVDTANITLGGLALNVGLKVASF